MHRQPFLAGFVFVATIGLFASCSGCQRKEPHTTAILVSAGSTTSVPLRQSQRLSVRSSAEYQEAVRRYARKDYHCALALLDTLLSSPHRTDAECAFLVRQRVLCERALTGPSSRAIHPSLTSPNLPLSASAPTDCGPRALLLACRKLGIPATLDELRQHAGTNSRGTTLDGLAHAAQAKGLQADGVQMDREALAHLDRIAIAWVDGDHYVAILSVDGDRATIHDPNKINEEVITTDELLRRTGGILLRLSR